MINAPSTNFVVKTTCFNFGRLKSLYFSPALHTTTFSRLTMARKKSKSIQRKGQGTPGRILNHERPPSTSTESFRSISPLIDRTTRMTIDEPTDLDLPPSFELTLTLQENVCRKRVLLTSRLTTMESGIDDIRNIVNNYKENGHDASSFLIQDQLKIKEHFEKERQQLMRFSPLPTPTQTKRKENSDGFINPPLRKITKTSRSNSTSELNFNIELANKFTSLDNLNIQSQPIADTTNLPHHPNIATTTNTAKPTNSSYA
ncbi:hypothetical protein TNCV_3361211 [Trichonephila clavipes]|nr:hypothetical protein TNCV_3361211 [Trichonephila clavipes]